MQLDTLIFDPSPCGFPKPRLPLLPVGLDGITFKTVPRWAPTEHFRHFARGRYALHAAYRLSGIGPGAALLAPAYHCRTMLDPALALGGNVLLYPLNADLSPKVDELERLARSSSLPIKALLAAHFFGFPQDFAGLAEWCAKRNITLIEDASHAFFTERYRPPGIGIYGEFVISSPYKFLPTPDGGLLFGRDPQRLQSVTSRTPAWREELRGVKSLVERYLQSRKQPEAGEQKNALATLVSQPPPPANEIRIMANHSSDYHPLLADLTSLRVSRMLYQHPDIATVNQKRRDNYQRWLATMKDLRGCRPLFSALPENCIPYMFPLYLEQPQTRFSLLKRLRVPIWRWDSLAVSACPIAHDYRLHLLHMPCHQSLSAKEMSWMMEVTRQLVVEETAHSQT